LQQSWRFVHEQTVVISHSSCRDRGRHRAISQRHATHAPRAASSKALRDTARANSMTFSTISVDNSVHIL
jgi:hypothetical protein